MFLVSASPIPNQFFIKYLISMSPWHNRRRFLPPRYRKRDKKNGSRRRLFGLESTHGQKSLTLDAILLTLGINDIVSEEARDLVCITITITSQMKLANSHSAPRCLPKPPRRPRLRQTSPGPTNSTRSAEKTSFETHRKTIQHTRLSRLRLPRMSIRSMRSSKRTGW